MEDQERRRRWGGRGEEEEEDENEQKQPGGFYLESHPLARHCSIIIASLFVFVSSSHTCTHARAFPTLQLHARALRPPAQLDGQAVKAGVN